MAEIYWISLKTEISIVEKFSTAGHIFNLGHGITPNAKIENVELLIKTIKDKI